MFVYLKSTNKRLIISLLLYFTFVELTSIFYTNSVSPLIVGLISSTKIVFIFLLYFLVGQILKQGFPIKSLLEIFLTSATLYSLGILIPAILDIGESTYASGTFGQKGFFASGNALGIYLGIAGSIATLRNNKTLKQSFQLFIIVLSLILLGTKTSLVFIFLISMIMIVQSGRVLPLLILSLGIVFISLHWQVISTIFSTIFDVVVYRFNNSDNLMTFILSGRDQYVIDAFNECMKSNIWLIKLIFGGGSYMSFRSSYHNGMVYDVLEMDFFDIFFMYGIIGVTIYSLLFGYFTLKAMSRSKYIFILMSFFFLHSALAGHVVFDGLSMTAGVVVIFMIRYYRDLKTTFKV